MHIRLGRWRRNAAISDLSDETTRDTRTGAVRSVQAAELVLTRRALNAIWSPAYLERLARTYWRFLARVTLGLVHVHYSNRERSVVLVLPMIRLITFAEPEYEMDGEHGVVRWRIVRGLLVARKRRADAAGEGPERQGHLQIEVRRCEDGEGARGIEPGGRLRIEIEVANFYPAIAFAFSRRLYDITQSRIHVLVTRAFLRSLARGSRDGVPDLAVSKVGRMTSPVAAPSGRDPEPPAARAS